MVQDQYTGIMPKTSTRVQKKVSRKKEPYRCNRSTIVAELIERCPRVERVLASYGLHCVGCAWSGAETLEEGFFAHGYDEEEFQHLLSDINAVIEEGGKPSSLTITESGARAIGEVAEKEGKKGYALEVIADEEGGFCLEFVQHPPYDLLLFSHRSVPDVRIGASKLTLERIGGATIDFRDGRFKLDLEGDNASSCPCNGACDCA